MAVPNSITVLKATILYAWRVGRLGLGLGLGLEFFMGRLGSGMES